MRNFLKENWPTWLAGFAFCLFIALGAFLFLAPMIFSHQKITIEMPELNFSLIFWGIVWLAIFAVMFIKVIKKSKDIRWWKIIILFFGLLGLSFLIVGMIWYIFVAPH